MQKNITKKHNEDFPTFNQYRNPAHQLTYYDFDKDHIPSKKSIILYLSNRDNHGIVYKNPINNFIERNAISVVMKKSIHKAGRTNGNDNKYIAIEDAKNLKKAVYDDFTAYYVLAYKNGYNDHLYKTNWVKALMENYVRNEALCLFI